MDKLALLRIEINDRIAKHRKQRRKWLLAGLAADDFSDKSYFAGVANKHFSVAFELEELLKFINTLEKQS